MLVPGSSLLPPVPKLPPKAPGDEARKCSVSVESSFHVHEGASLLRINLKEKSVLPMKCAPVNICW